MNQASVYNHKDRFSNTDVDADVEGSNFANEKEQFNEQPAAGCCSCREFKRGWFNPIDANGRSIDFDASFNVGPVGWAVKLTKIVCLGIMLSNLIIGVLIHPTPDFYLAYLTHWSLIVSIVYQVLSTVASFKDSASTGLLRSIWLLFSISFNAEILVSFLFWFLEFDSEYVLKYTTVVGHGGVAFLLLIDGLIVNRTPVRLSHWVFSFLYMIIYSSWTLIQQFVLSYNPGEDDDDDAIYDALAWKKDFGKAATLLAMVIFIASPVVHIVVWAASRCGRKYDN